MEVIESDVQPLILDPTEELIVLDGVQFRRSALLEQLERIVGSKHFRNSKRYPTFLRFVVEETLAGRTESLKERTLGVDVFARPSDYDTNADPVVRVTAGEIRKRIAQYYQEPGHDRELRIDLPLGAYVPHFFVAGSPLPTAEESLPPAPPISKPQELLPVLTAAAPVVVEAGTVIGAPAAEITAPAEEGPRRKISGLLGAMFGVALIGVLMLAWSLLTRRSEAGLNSVWQPVLVSRQPVLVIIGVHSFDSQGREEQMESHASAMGGGPKDMLDSMVREDMVPVSDIVSYSHVTNLLTRRGRGYATWGSADATLEQMRNGPVVLIGAFNNLWTLRLTSKLRYRFQQVDQSENEIIDSEQPKRTWRFDSLQRATGNTQDFAIVASYFDSTIDQPVLIAAGIGKAGTQVAAEFLTSDEALRSWLQQARVGSHKNVELVLSTEILDGKAGPPHVVASAVW